MIRQKTLDDIKKELSEMNEDDRGLITKVKALAQYAELAMPVDDRNREALLSKLRLGDRAGAMCILQEGSQRVEDDERRFLGTPRGTRLR